MVAKIRKIKPEPVPVAFNAGKFINELVKVDVSSGDDELVAGQMRALQQRVRLTNEQAGQLSKLALYINYFMQSNSAAPVEPTNN